MQKDLWKAPSEFVYPDAKVDMPFPTTTKLLEWPTIEKLVEKDTSIEQLEESFAEVQDGFDRALVERSSGTFSISGVLEQTRKTILSSRVLEVQPAKPSHPRENLLIVATSPLTFTKPDGTTTTDLSDLPRPRQILLWADAMLRSPISCCMYPSIVPTARGFKMMSDTFVPKEMLYGQRWDPNQVTRDDEGSAIARVLLEGLGCSGAASAEMKAIGPKFNCGRCDRGLPESWEDLVREHPPINPSIAE
jgi:hypothetical protein